MNTKEILERALEVITPPGTWCINSRGIDRNGGFVFGHDPTAVQRCALGALEAAVGRQWWDSTRTFDEPMRLLDRAAHSLYLQEGSESPPVARDFVRYNNHHTHEEVKLMFKAALYLCDEEEGV